ncbi:MAG: DUF3631 domain-containing protein [Chloroflexota bacterium]|nr:DUF3631 domain-containing protein [Chloroflexota bacterium]
MTAAIPTTDFIRALWQPGDVREVRIPKYDGVKTAAGWFDDPDLLAGAVDGWDGKANVYITLNPVNPALLARASNRIQKPARATTSDRDTARRRWLLVDLDPERPAGISSTEQEREAAHHKAQEVYLYLLEQDWPTPISGMSGNGYQLLYPIDLPNDDDSRQLVEGVLAHLNAKFSDAAVKIDTAVGNAARISCLFGTMKVKGDDGPERPHRRSQLLAGPAELIPVPPERLQALVPASNGHTPTSTYTIRSMPVGWVKDWLDAARVTYREHATDGVAWYRLRVCPAHPDDDIDGDCGAAELPGGAAVFKCFHDRGKDKDWKWLRAALKLEPPKIEFTAGTLVDKADPPSTFQPPAVAESTTSVELNLVDYLAAVEAFLTRYVAFPSEHEPVAVALWVAHAHLVEQFDTSPILAITSAELRSGKTRVLDCLELLVPQPERSITPSEAVLYTILSERPRPTLLLDEVDAIFGPRTNDRNEGVRAILNSGNRKGTSVPRVKLEGRRREVERFDVFGPKAIAGIGNLPTTVADRAIPIRMKRRAPAEKVERFRDRQARAESAGIRFPVLTVPLVPDVPVPEALNDRAADSWEPLLSIADTVGQAWPERARLAALELSCEVVVDSSGIRLLTDIRDAFNDLTVDHLSTHDLLRYLHDLDEAPWGDWYGKPLSARALSRLLEPYRVRPTQRRVAGGMMRGYFRLEFTDAWARYVPARETGTSGTPGTPGTPRLWEQGTGEAEVDVLDVSPSVGGVSIARREPEKSATTGKTSTNVYVSQLPETEEELAQLAWEARRP